MPELLKYREIRTVTKFDADFDVIQFWHQFNREMPILSELSLKALSVPASSVSVERSFSCLKRTLTALRNNFTESNLGVHLRLNFNSKLSRREPTEHSEQEESGSDTDEN